MIVGEISYSLKINYNLSMLKNYLLIFFATRLIYLFFLLLPLFLIKKLVTLTLKIMISVSLAYFFSSAVKYFFPIERPFFVQNIIPLLGEISGSSFPSEHAAISSAFAFSVLFEKKILGLVLVVFSLAIGVARVLLFVHYPIDIIAGLVIGASFAYLIHRLHVYF